MDPGVKRLAVEVADHSIAHRGQQRSVLPAEFLAGLPFAVLSTEDGSVIGTAVTSRSAGSFPRLDLDRTADAVGDEAALMGAMVQ
jgi:hypothetical protein